jgi:hypothetical protein
VLKLGDISFEQLVKDRILSVLGMNDTRIALSENEITNVNRVIYISDKFILLSVRKGLSLLAQLSF